MKLSSVFDARLESRNGKINGYILGVRQSEGKIKFLHCCDFNDNEFFVDVDDVILKDDKIIFSRTLRPQRADVLRLGCPAYNYTGKFLGSLTEIELDKFNIKWVFVGNKKYSSKRTILGDAIIIKGRQRTIAPDISPDLYAKDMLIDTLCR